MSKSSRPLYISYAGPSLLEMPLLNKGSAFTPQERVEFNLIGLLPQNVETIEEQVARVFSQYNQCASDLDKHIYLRSIQDNNETLFFRLLDSHLDEMLPIIYTPTVGQACQEFSKIYRTHRGLFISYPERDRIDDILRSASPGTTRRQRDVSRRSSKVSGCGRLTLDYCPWRGRWSTSACCRWVS